jgi:hypothetical protein
MTEESLFSFPSLEFEFSQVSAAVRALSFGHAQLLSQIELPVFQIPQIESPMFQIVQESVLLPFQAFSDAQRSLVESMEASSRAAAEGFRQFREAFKKAEAIGRYGWTISMEATLPDIFSLVDMITDEASADAAFVWYFSQDDEVNLKTLIHGAVSNPLLDPWKPAIEEAIECLQDKKYRACIALLLPIVDGFYAQRFSCHKFHIGKQREKFFETRLQAMADDSIEKLMWRSFIAFAETFFHFVDFGSPGSAPPVLNRHLLLHGRGIPQDKLEDCLRLLQVLETITDLEL